MSLPPDTFLAQPKPISLGYKHNYKIPLHWWNTLFQQTKNNLFIKSGAFLNYFRPVSNPKFHFLKSFIQSVLLDPSLPMSSSFPLHPYLVTAARDLNPFFNSSFWSFFSNNKHIQSFVAPALCWATNGWWAELQLVMKSKEKLKDKTGHDQEVGTCFSFRQKWKELHPLRKIKLKGELFPAQSKTTLSSDNISIKPPLGTNEYPKSPEYPTRTISLS